VIFEAIVEASAPPGFKDPNALASSSTTTPADAAPPKMKPAKKPKSEGVEAEDEIDESQVGVGSIAGGGRYDNLVWCIHRCCGW